MTAGSGVLSTAEEIGARLRRRRYSGRLILQLGPGTFWLVVFFLVPILLVLIYSFYGFANGQMIPVFTLENYVRAFETDVYRQVLFKSMRYGLITSALCLLIAYPAAYTLARSSYKRKELLFLLLIIPFWTSIVVRTFAWKIMLGSNGFVNFTLRELGLIELPIRFLYAEPAVIIGLVHVFLPFMVLPLYAVLEKMDPALEEASSDLGAGRLRTFLRVTLPLSLPGVSTGFMLVFLLTVGSYLTPDILGGPGELMISNVIRAEYYVTFNWPFGGALAAIFLALTLIVILVYNRLFRFERTLGK